MPRLLSELATQTWAMSERALQAFLRAVEAAESAKDPIGTDLQAAMADSDEPSYRRNGRTAEIAIRGPLLRGRGSRFLRAWGVQHTGYADIADQIAQAMGDSGVDDILLDVDSPGGAAQGLALLADSIAEAAKRKKVRAYVSGMAASAAYYLASQADEIAAEPDAIVGSIGVYAVVRDYSAMLEAEGIKTHVLRSGPYKGAGAVGDEITDEQLGVMQEVIDDLAAGFVDRVALGRGMPIPKVQEIATGADWLAPRALELGLIDSVGPRESAGAVGKAGGIDVAENTTQIPAEPAADKSATIAELKALAPERPGFVLEQVEAGATLAQAEMALLRLERDELKAENERLALEASKPAPAPKREARGVDPLDFDGDQVDANDGAFDFMAEARALRMSSGKSMTAAMREVARRNPAAHTAWVEGQRAEHNKRNRRGSRRRG